MVPTTTERTDASSASRTLTPTARRSDGSFDLDVVCRQVARFFVTVAMADILDGNCIEMSLGQLSPINVAGDAIRLVGLLLKVK
jgi:hypothetical protein